MCVMISKERSYFFRVLYWYEEMNDHLFFISFPWRIFHFLVNGFHIWFHIFFFVCFVFNFHFQSFLFLSCCLYIFSFQFVNDNNIRKYKISNGIRIHYEKWNSFCVKNEKKETNFVFIFFCFLTFSKVNENLKHTFTLCW